MGHPDRQQPWDRIKWDMLIELEGFICTMTPLVLLMVRLLPVPAGQWAG